MPDRAETAGVIMPPPLIALVTLLAGLALDWLLPTSVLSDAVPSMVRVAIGLLLMIGGLAMVIAANLTFRKAGTNVEPWKPSLILVDQGVFGWLRNPMYVGGTLFLLGLALALGSDWLLLTMVVSMPVLHFGVVRREERYLESRFGESYRSYCAAIGRYGWRW